MAISLEYLGRLLRDDASALEKWAKQKVKEHWIDQGKSKEEAEEKATRWENNYGEAWDANSSDKTV